MSTKLEVGKNLAVIVPAVKRPSISSSRFEIRKTSDTGVKSHRTRTSKLCYRMADLVMIMTIVFPLSICIWRGVWQLMDFYSDKWGVDPWLSISVGYMIPFVLYLCQEPLKRQIIPGRIHFFTFYIISKLLLLLHGLGSINQWRGLWKLLDKETGLGSTSALATLIVGIFFSVVTRTFSNVLASPLLACVDDASTIHDCPLRFKTRAEDTLKYICDCAFSVFIIQSLTICSWRGLWNLADIYLYPEDAYMSCIASLGFGYSLCIILCATQPLVCDYVCSLKGLVRMTIIDMSYLIGFIGCVFAWRGVWNACNLFIVFETQNLSEWVMTFVGAIGMVLLGCVSTISARGIAIDGDLEEDEAAEWLIPYISHLRTYNSEIPFPEPWLLRYLCTSQKMNTDKIRPIRDRRRNKQMEKSNELESVTEPLKKQSNNLSNSIHPITEVIPPPGDDDGNGNLTTIQRENKRNSNTRIRLSQLHHIDSSSEEELGTRETMDANPEVYESLESGNTTTTSKSRLQEVVTMQTD